MERVARDDIGCRCRPRSAPAMAEYVPVHARPAATCPVCSSPPVAPFQPDGHLDASGGHGRSRAAPGQDWPGSGPHGLRHAAGQRVCSRAGASMAEIGQVLRHAQPAAPPRSTPSSTDATLIDVGPALPAGGRASDTIRECRPSSTWRCADRAGLPTAGRRSDASGLRRSARRVRASGRSPPPRRWPGRASTITSTMQRSGARSAGGAPDFARHVSACSIRTAEVPPADAGGPQRTARRRHTCSRRSADRRARARRGHPDGADAWPPPCRP